MTMRLLFFLSAAVSVLFSQQDSITLQLANAERSFSALSEKEGIKNSFLTYLDDDCIMFNPHPVNGKQLYATRPANTALLSWFPLFVEVAASGDFGISTGPWEYRKSKQDTVLSVGYFFSIWKKNREGNWKVALDFGINFPKDKLRVEQQDFHSHTRTSKRVLYPESAQAELKKIENKFIKNYRTQGAVDAYEASSSGNLRMYREGSFPAVDKKESLEMIQQEPPLSDFIPLETSIAFTGDLGYVYGYAVDAKNDSSSYVRVWRLALSGKEKEWKIAIDILKPFKQ